MSYGIIKDPIYGYIRLDTHEREIINTTIFQRLRRIKQVSLAHLVYPGATHTRFAHSLGVMHLSGFFTDVLLTPLLTEGLINREEKARYVSLMRLWGLLHDIGHGPFGHVFDRIVLEPRNTNHELLGAKIIKNNSELQTIFNNKSFSKLNIPLEKLIQIQTSVASEELEQEKDKIGKSEIEVNSLFWIAKGVYSADIMDFLLRDSLFSGAGYCNFDRQRLIHYSYLHEAELVLQDKAREALDSFLLSRFFLFTTVYYHRTTRVFERISEFLLREIPQEFWDEYVNDIEKYCSLDEESLLNNLQGLVSALNNMQKPEKEKILNNQKLVGYINCLKNRKLLYTNIDSKRIGEQKRDSLFLLNKPGIPESELKRLIDNQLPEEAYFIDYPALAIIPMKGRDTIPILNNSTNKIEYHSAKETSWKSELPEQYFALRLYIHNDYKTTENIGLLKSKFSELIEGEESSTHM